MALNKSEILDAIADNLTQPKRARTDAGEVEQHDLDKQLEAAKFVMSRRANAVSPFGALRMAIIEAPGATG
jgi:hypothetical protein